MMSSTFKLSAITVAVATQLLTACGGGGSGSTTATPTPATPSVAPTTEPALDAAKAFLAKYEASIATAIPTTGAAALEFRDGCSLTNGRSKAYSMADFDADPNAVASRQGDVGSTRSNVTVLAERSLANADGTSRREIDVKFDITYKDGSKYETPANTVPDETLISGSSSGAKLADGSTCATPDSKSDWRFYGNRKVVQTFVNATNERIERTTLATGLSVTPAVVYSSSINLGVQDPAKIATYATITGPGLGGSGVVGTLKLLSVRILRDAPELVGKPRNFVDWRDTDSFQVCRTSTGAAAAADAADCVANGANGNGWGVFNNATPASVDSGFASIGIRAGDAYTFNIYGDDGWKTVNGQAGKTPIATYTSTLRALPLSTVTLAGAGVTADLFGRVASSTKTGAESATAVRTKAALASDITWTAPGTMPDGRKLQLNDMYVYQQGQANTTGATWPASRKLIFSYPGALATAMTLSIPVPVTALVVPNFASFSLEYNNRNGNNVYSSYAFQ